MKLARPTAHERALARLRLDSRTELLRTNKGATAVPQGGWIRATRYALGMTLDDLALRMGVAKSTVSRLESSERKGTAQLDSLRKAAQALNCELVYALVPRMELEKVVGNQRSIVAGRISSKAQLHMALEGQYLDDRELEDWRQDFANTLVDDRRLWKTPK